jgi:hypothetical protein
MKKFYKDFYGCTASIEEHRDGSATLRMVAGNTRTKKTFKTVRGAKQSMYRASDGWKEQN